MGSLLQSGDPFYFHRFRKYLMHQQEAISAMSIIVVDCQTSGLDHNVHQLIGIAIIRCSSDFEIVDQLKLNILYDNYYVSPKAVAANKVDLRDYTGWVTEADARRAVFKFLSAAEDFDKCFRTGTYKKHTYAGMNVQFDMPFVKKFLTPAAFDKIFRYRPYDAIGFYDFLYRIGVVEEAYSNKLIDLAKSLGVKLDKSLRIDNSDPMRNAEISRLACRELSRLADGLAELVQKKGYTVKGLLKSNKTVAKTKNKDLAEARAKLKLGEDEDEQE